MVTTQDHERRPALTPAEQDANERRYHVAMAKLTAERGYLNLSQAHALAAKVCARGCPCDGCKATRAEADEHRAAKARRANRARRDAA